MHIALYSPAWPPGLIQNGIVTFVDWMERELKALGHRVSIFTWYLGDAAQRGEAHRVVDHRSPLRRRLERRLPGRWGELASSRAIGQAILDVHRRDPIDVIEMEESFGWSADVETITGVPVLVKLHGPAFQSLTADQLAMPEGQRRVEREGLALSKARAIAAPAAEILRATLARYRLDPAVQARISNPLDVDAPVPLWRAEAADRRLILFVGRFDRRKGGDLMLDAFGRLASRRPELRLIFVGPDSGFVQDDGERVGLDAYAERRLSAEVRSRIDYRGPLSAADILPLRCRAAVTVAPSRWENQSYAAIEAMLQGCPVVASDVGGTPESVRHLQTGRLHRPGDAAHLAEQLEAMLDDPAASARMGQAAREHVRHEHAARRIALESIELYQRVIAAAGR